MMPLISIIVPVYNVEPYLRECLDSILAQSYENWEAVLVDDGSTDMSGSVCDEYAAKDSRFIVVHKQNEGVVLARLSAFQHCHGEYITFIDSDDCVTPEYVAHLYSCIKNHAADVSCCQFARLTDTGLQPENRPECGFFNQQRIRTLLQTDFLYNKEIGMSGMPVFLCTKMIRREYVKEMMETGSGLWYGEDLVSCYWLLQQISSIYISDEVHYFYICRAGQATEVLGYKRWDAHVAVWNRLKELDVNGYLNSQFPYRIFGVLCSFLLQSAQKGSLAEFVNIYKYSTGGAQIVREKFLQYKFKDLSLPKSFILRTLQHSHPYILFICLRIIGFIKTRLHSVAKYLR